MANKKLRAIKRNRFALLALLIGCVACLLIWTDQEASLQAKLHEKEFYDNQKAELETLVEDLRSEVAALDTEEAIELFARIRLGLIKSDEIEYIIKNKEED